MTASRTRGPYVKGVERREQILRTALEVFSEGGYHRSSLKEIARRVGVTEPTLFHYFGSKEALLAAVLAARDERTGEVVDAGDVLDGLLAATRRNVGTPDLVRLYATTSAEATEPGHAAHDWFRDRYASVRQEIAERLADRVPADADPEWVARILIAVMDGLQIQWLLDRDVDMVGDMERLAAALLPDA
ncbi:TetR/AcrR family transcriptional regulator [Pseudonocardia nigra]|uniref:TetR/AcrR family transcriptional regulator n=1 Tax=Pseudonocardia nigra TaxID=1921578 RepID=UPI001C5D0DE3|nr:TetR/AcrR family transcriptional regulator [Pseudonocardia nigra]